MAVLPWGAFGPDDWNIGDDLADTSLANLLIRYADLLVTPVGPPAACGLELIMQLRPPQPRETTATSGRTLAETMHGVLTRPVEPAPPEAPLTHPAARGRGFDDVMHEDTHDWFRSPTPEEIADCSHVAVVDVNFFLANSASQVKVAYSQPQFVDRPAFDPKIPGCWYADLSDHPFAQSSLPSPFTPDGRHPAGPRWYTTPTLAYAAKAHYTVSPIKAYLRYGRTNCYLDTFNHRLRDAYLTVVRRLGIDTDMKGPAFVRAWQTALTEGDPAEWALIAMIKATADGGIDALQHVPADCDQAFDQRWPALAGPTWRPDVRAAVIAAARTELHRKIGVFARATGRRPLAVHAGRVLYPVNEDTAGDLVSDIHDTDSSFTLGPRFGHVTCQGVLPMAWAVGMTQQALNPASRIPDPPGR